ncbi:MAG: hypothetical protein NC433_06820 [Clostridiales bacterium]|nr:hypothetical protein [Clostridiales bacterium]
MYYDTAIYWNEAKTSGVNKASMLVLQALTVQGRVLMAALCDGTGEIGEYAGGYLTKELMEWFYDGLPEALVKRNSLSVIKRHVERAVYKAQRRMYEYVEAHGEEYHEAKDYGVEYHETEDYEVEYHEAKDYGVKECVVSLETTVSLLILWEKKYLLWNYGDNHVYRFSADGRTKCPLSDFEMGMVRNKDMFLICSNTFIHRVSEHEIADILELNTITGIPSLNKIGRILASKGITSILTLNVLSMERCRRRLKEIGEAAIRKGESGSMSAVCVRISSHKRRMEGKHAGFM